MDLTSLVTGAIKDSVIDEISSKMWMDSGSAKSAIMSALPMIMGGLSKNADSDEGAEAINKAVEKHTTDDNGIMSMIGKLAGNPDAGEWAGILKHILGGSEENVANAVAKKSWIDSTQASGLLKILAPMVMGKLGEAKASGLNVGSLLQKETENKSILTSFLDQDGDWEITDDLLKMWGNFLKNKFFG